MHQTIAGDADERDADNGVLMFAAADVTGDDWLDNSDITAILTYYSYIISEIPYTGNIGTTYTHYANGSFL